MSVVIRDLERGSGTQSLSVSPADMEQAAFLGKLAEHGIEQPLKLESVLAHKESVEQQFARGPGGRRLRNKGRVDSAWAYVTAIGFIFALIAFVLVGQPVAPTYLEVAIVTLGSTIGTVWLVLFVVKLRLRNVRPEFWFRWKIQYYPDQIPMKAHLTAIRIARLFPDDQICVETFGDDPLLVVMHEGVDYYFWAWDELGFTGTR